MWAAFLFFPSSGTHPEDLSRLKRVSVHSCDRGVNILASPEVKTIIVKLILESLSLLI
jgi:hypothetical protein